MKESYEELQKQLNIKRILEELENKKGQMNTDYYLLSEDIREKKGTINKLQIELEKLSKSFINKIISNKKNKDLKDQINKIQIEIKNLEQEREKQTIELKQIEEQIEKQKAEYRPGFDKTEVVLSQENNIITINDKLEIDTIPNERQQDVIIHATDFFPKNKLILCNYDGNKEKIYKPDTNNKNTIQEEIKYLSHRHTVHFVVNNVIGKTPDGAGNWEQSKFIIIEPLSIHKNQFVTDTNRGTDNYTYGSVTLGEKPILVVREDAFAEIPEEEKQNYNIIKYSGNHEICIQNLLALLGVERRKIDNGDTIHSRSLEHNVEQSLDARNIIMNYLGPQKYNGKDKISVDEQKLFQMYEMAPHIVSSYYASNTITHQINNISKIKQVPADFIKFIISFGIEKTNHDYTFKSDDELYYELKRLEELTNKISKEEKNKYVMSTYNFDEIATVYEKYKEYKEQKEKRIVDTITKIIGNDHHIIPIENGIEIKYYIDNRIFDMEKIESLGLDIAKDKFNQVIIQQKLTAPNEKALYEKIKKLMKIINTAKKDINNTNEIENSITR